MLFAFVDFFFAGGSGNISGNAIQRKSSKGGGASTTGTIGDLSSVSRYCNNEQCYESKKKLHASSYIHDMLIVNCKIQVYVPDCHICH